MYNYDQEAFQRRFVGPPGVTWTDVVSQVLRLGHRALLGCSERDRVVPVPPAPESCCHLAKKPP